MKRFMEKPIVLHWDMHQNSKEEKQRIAEKIQNLAPIKLRFINSCCSDDWKIIEQFLYKKSAIQRFQVEYDFLQSDIPKCLRIDFQNKVEILPKCEGDFKLNDDLIKKIKNLSNIKSMMQILFYITHDNVTDCVQIIDHVQRINQLNFCIKLDKKAENELIHTSRLHQAIVQISKLYEKYPSINLISYDDEKIIKDILPLQYYCHANMYINSEGKIAFYNFLPFYECGVLKTADSLEQSWDKLCKNHIGDLDRILEHPRYWLKKLNGR